MASGLARHLLIGVICAYKVGVRPLLLGSCKFYPTCSDYGIEALRTHGVLRGGGLTLRRLARCHPFGPGGIDLVPDPREQRSRKG